MSGVRVVVTGLGCVTPYGVGVQALWQGLCSGVSAVTAHKLELPSNLPVKVAATIPDDKSINANAFVPQDHFTATELRRTHKFVQLAIVAATEALTDAGLTSLTPEQLTETGVSVGSGVGSLEDIMENAKYVESNDIRKISPFFVPRMLINMPAGEISIRFRLQGPNHSAVTACATGAHSIGDALRFIQHGQASVMLAGGTDACVNSLALAGFHRLKSLSLRSADEAPRASRPWDKNRDGFVMGEGAGILVLEEREHALQRGAKIYAELAGYGASGDGHHVTAPLSDGSGASLAIARALREAGIAREELTCLNAHATSTQVGDVAELRALQRAIGMVWGKNNNTNNTNNTNSNSGENVTLESVAVTSNKGGLGHLLGAAGAVEAIACVLGIHTSTVPPSINLDDLDSEAAATHALFAVPGARCVGRAKWNQPAALSNSFGFGGTNAALLFKQHTSNS